MKKKWKKYIINFTKKKEWKKYIINFTKKKEWKEVFEIIKDVQNFRKKYKIQNTQCFLTNLTKSFTWKNIKMKIDYLNFPIKGETGLTITSDNWINHFNNNSNIKIVLKDEWNIAGFFKYLPEIYIIGAGDFETPEEIIEAIFECFLMLTENIKDTSENIKKNYDKFLREVSLKNFGITQ